MGSSSKFALALLMGSACMTAPSLVFAQAAPTPAAAGPTSEPNTGGIADIVVTATRRSERLLTVPISDTALSTAKLAEKQIADSMTLANVVPNMQAKPTLSPLEMTVAIRGVSQLIPEVSFDPAIGTYVDGIYNVIDAGSNNALIDEERVEVLKGPQGTLFGRNTIGGAISITTNKPTDDWGGSIEQDLGNYGAFTTTAVLNAPILPGRLDTRFVYQHNQHTGYGVDFTTLNPTSTLNSDYFRGSAKLFINQDWDAVVTAFYQHAYGFGAGTKTGDIDDLAPLDINETLPAASGHPGDLLSNYIGKGGWQDTYGQTDNRYSLNQYGVTATITGRLNDNVSVKSITGYVHTGYNTESELSGTPYIAINLYAYPINADQISQELQVYGDAFEKRLTYIAGLYYFNEKASQISNDQALPAVLGAFVTSSGPHVNNQSYSAFGQITYEFLPNLRFTGGVRYVLDDRAVFYNDQTQAAPYPGPFLFCNLANVAVANGGNLGTNPAACNWNASTHYSYVPWTAGIDYRPNNNTMLYVKVSQGYRSGAFGLNGPQANPAGGAGSIPSDEVAIANWGPVGPESLLSPEAGFKLDLLDHKLQINAAAFYSWYNNVQVQINGPIVGTTPINELVNGGSQEAWGGELEATALLGDLQLDGSVGYADPQWTKAGPQSNFVGTQVANVSKLTAAITATYPFQLSAGLLTVSGTYSYRSSELLSTNGITNPPFTAAQVASSNAALTQPGFGMLGARATFRLASFPITFALFGQNLTNVHWKSSATNFPFGVTVFWPGAPLTFGGSLRYDF